METWKESAKRFFDERAELIDGLPSWEALCYVSGRDPRFWANTPAYQDLVDSIIRMLGATKDHELLELGCAAGFIARGIAPRVGRYVGVDIAMEPLKVARRLRLANAEFRLGDGMELPFPEGTIDHAFSYDVITNLPSFEAAADLVRQMFKVVKPGGRVLVGSVPDAAQEEAFVQEVQRVQASLSTQATTGPEPVAGPLLRFRRWLRKRDDAPPPAITCYYFEREDFAHLGRSLGATTEFLALPDSWVYAPFRFNVVFHKPVA